MLTPLEKNALRAARRSALHRSKPRRTTAPVCRCQVPATYKPVDVVSLGQMLQAARDRASRERELERLRLQAAGVMPRLSARDLLRSIQSGFSHAFWRDRRATLNPVPTGKTLAAEGTA